MEEDYRSVSVSFSAGSGAEKRYKFEKKMVEESQREGCFGSQQPAFQMGSV